jgi:divalent metal cation (Fe/Co/Zn/Cd) transporter
MLRRRARTDRLAAEAKGLPPAVQVAIAAVAAAGVLGLVYIVRRRLWQAVAVAADAVEEVADTVEDAAEDVRDAARARAQ